MNNRASRSVRLLLLTLVAASFGACHFHGGCGHDYHSCWHVPVRHCR